MPSHCQPGYCNFLFVFICFYYFNVVLLPLENIRFRILLKLIQMTSKRLFPKMTLTDKQRTNSVPNPFAQSATLYELSNPDNDNIYTSYKRIVLSYALSAVECAVIELLMCHGLRISEVLRIKTYDIKSSGHIVIKGLKGSNDRLILPAMNLSFWMSSGSGMLPIQDTFSRFYFYRLFKRIGLYEKFEGHVNNSVTHSFRQKLLRGLKKDGVNSSLLSDFIGHVSKKTIKYYESIS